MWKPVHAVVCCLVFVSQSAACLWDFDTLAMERRRFPSAHELVVGKFLRHSNAFYRWRVEDRTKRIAKRPTPPLYDDLAVAYDKLGEHQRAIETILKKQQLFPDRDEYETEANLATFLIHAGRFEEGLTHIDRALELNPDAHFGREKYQQQLVRYVLEKQRGDQLHLPLDDERMPMQLPGFARFILESEGALQDGERKTAEIEKASKGILGMMRFGQHDSPVLLEALGDLLLAQGYPEDSKRLAARAYLRAAATCKEYEAKQAYRELAESSLKMQTIHPMTYSELSLAKIESQLEDELADAADFTMQIEQDELRWIASGKNADEEFAAKYYVEPSVKRSIVDRIWRGLNLMTIFFVAIVVAIVVAIAVLLGVVVVRRFLRIDRSRHAATQPADA